MADTHDLTGSGALVLIVTALVSYSFLLFFIRVGGGEGTPRLFRIISPLMLLDQFGANPHSLLGVGS